MRSFCLIVPGFAGAFCCEAGWKFEYSVLKETLSPGEHGELKGPFTVCSSDSAAGEKTKKLTLKYEVTK